MQAYMHTCIHADAIQQTRVRKREQMQLPDVSRGPGLPGTLTQVGWHSVHRRGHVALPPPLLVRARLRSSFHQMRICEMRRLSWEQAMCKRKAKKDAPAAAVSRVSRVSRAPPADASRPALSGWGRPAWSLLVKPHLTISQTNKQTNISEAHPPTKILAHSAWLE